MDYDDDYEMSMDVGEIAPPQGPDGTTFKFDQIGSTVKGEVIHLDKMVRRNELSETKRREEVLVISLRQLDGSVYKIWPITNTDYDGDGYPSRMARAISAAITAVGERKLRTGAMLAVQWSDALPAKQPGHQPAKVFRAQYQPPAPAISTDLLGAPAPAPAQQAQYQAPPPVAPAPVPAAPAADLLAPPAPPQQTAPAVNGDTVSDLI